MYGFFLKWVIDDKQKAKDNCVNQIEFELKDCEKIDSTSKKAFSLI